MAIDENYLNSLSPEQLRDELRYYLELHYGILFALRDVPDMPSPFVLMHLGTAAKWPKDKARGLAERQKQGMDAIPPKSECESGAGLWQIIRDAIRAARHADEQLVIPSKD